MGLTVGGKSIYLDVLNILSPFNSKYWLKQEFLVRSLVYRIIRGKINNNIFLYVIILLSFFIKSL